MAVYMEEDLGEKNPKQTNQTRKKKEKKSLNMTHTKDILPPHLKYNVIITELTSRGRKGRIYYPQRGAKQDFQEKIHIPHKERGRAQSWLTVRAAAHSDTAELT